MLTFLCHINISVGLKDRGIVLQQHIKILGKLQPKAVQTPSPHQISTQIRCHSLDQFALVANCDPPSCIGEGLLMQVFPSLLN